MTDWLQYITAIGITAHGLAYIPFGIVVPHSLERSYGYGSSHLLGTLRGGERLQRLMLRLHVAAGLALLASSACLAIGGWSGGWWRAFAIAGSAVGLIAFVVLWDGRSMHAVEEGSVGAAISVLVLAGALLLPRFVS